MRNYSSKKDIIRHKYLTYIYSKAPYLHLYLCFIQCLAASLLALHGKANNATFYFFARNGCFAPSTTPKLFLTLGLHFHPIT